MSEKSNPPVPEGVWYGEETDNFYSVAARRGMGMAFWLKWRLRKHEFPTDPDKLDFAPSPDPRLLEAVEAARLIVADVSVDDEKRMSAIAALCEYSGYDEDDSIGKYRGILIARALLSLSSRVDAAREEMRERCAKEIDDMADGEKALVVFYQNANTGQRERSEAAEYAHRYAAKAIRSLHLKA